MTSKGCVQLGDTYTLVAKNLAFNTNCMSIARGKETTITLENKDKVRHNLHITADYQEFTTGKPQPGPFTKKLRVNVDKPGSYVFVCDIHPNMEGRLIVT